MKSFPKGLRRYGRVVAVGLTMVLLLSIFLAGCGKVNRDTKVVLTTGFAKGELFKIDEVKCTIPEMMVYLTNMQNQYEDVYGTEIWNTKIDGVSLETNVKDNALSKIAQVKTIVLLAARREIALSDKELEEVERATDIYWNSLTAEEISALEIDRDIIFNMYSEYALADKVYQDMIKDVNPEISDDEARTITVQQIFLKTYAVNDDGENVRYNKSMRENALEQANEIAQRAKDGEDFEQLAIEYGLAEDLTVSFGEGEVDPAIEEAGFGLGIDEISGVIEAQNGYAILKCISTFNREETEENKKNIVERRKREAFSAEYEEFVSTLTKALNEDAWNEISFIHGDNITTSSFFEVLDGVLDGSL